MLNPEVFVRAAELMAKRTSHEQQGACFAICDAAKEIFEKDNKFRPYDVFFERLYRGRGFRRAYYMAYGDSEAGFFSCLLLSKKHMKERRILALLLAAEIARDEAKLPKSSKKRQK